MKAVMRDGMQANLDRIRTLRCTWIEEESGFPADEPSKQEFSKERRTREFVLDGVQARQKEKIEVFEEKKAKWTPIYDRVYYFDENQRTVVAEEARKVARIDRRSVSEPLTKDLNCGYRILKNTTLASILNHPKSEVVMGADNHIIATIASEEGSFKLWVAAEQGYLITRMEAYSKNGKLVAERRNCKTRQIDGAWLLVEMQEVMFGLAKDGGDYVRTIRVEPVEVNVEILRSELEVVIPPKYTVKNNITGEVIKPGAPAAEDRRGLGFGLFVLSLVLLCVGGAKVVLPKILSRS